MISCRDWWPWMKPGYITMTRRQNSNQWSGGIVAHPAPPQKISDAKIRWKSFRLDFLGSRRYPPHWLSSKGPNCQIGVLLISADAIEGHLKEKRRREFHQGGLVFAWLCPGSPGTCNPEVTSLPWFPMSWSPTLFSGSGPAGLPLVPWTEKRTIGSCPFFVRRGGHCSRGDLVGRTKFWIFLSGLQNLEQRAKKCIGLRGEYAT